MGTKKSRPVVKEKEIQNPTSVATKDPPIEATITSIPKSNWLVVGGDFEVKVFPDCCLNELNALYKAYKNGSEYRLFTPQYSEINEFKNRSIVIKLDPNTYPSNSYATWAYHRDIASYSTRNPQISLIPSMNYFIFAQFYKNTISNALIPESLRISLLTHLNTLSKDCSVQYDLRDSSTGQYLYYKTKRFAVPNIKEMLSQNEWITTSEDTNEIDLKQFDTGLPAESYQVEPKFDTNDCITYTIQNKGNKDVTNKQRNTAFVHDLIDPNKNLFDHKLWIPTIFDGEYQLVNPNNFNVNDIIKSPIVNLDYVKYKPLYRDIALVFKLLMQPMFENVLNYKLGANEKVVVKSMKYVLQKPLDLYEGNVHREGMGENIVGVGIYYPQVSHAADGMKYGALKLSIPDVVNAFLKCGAHEFEIEEGSCMVFSNQGYHQLPLMQYDDKVSTMNNTHAISRTILVFFLVNRYNSEGVIASDHASLLNVNLSSYWMYYVSHWLREHGFDVSVNYSWMHGVIYHYLFEKNHNDYVYYRRFKMRQEKHKPLHDEAHRILGNNDYNLSGEESSYYFGDNQTYHYTE